MDKITLSFEFEFDYLLFNFMLTISLQIHVKSFINYRFNYLSAPDNAIEKSWISKRAYTRLDYQKF